ncbi:MAG: hypothetical protein K0S32_1697 [Bacteroidetes bacterium]|jgi:hypothetical protein|nr:hypothetical protein [Bacteroidota bacterium]
MEMMQFMFYRTSSAAANQCKSYFNHIDFFVKQSLRLGGRNTIVFCPQQKGR